MAVVVVVEGGLFAKCMIRKIESMMSRTETITTAIMMMESDELEVEEEEEEEGGGE